MYIWGGFRKSEIEFDYDKTKYVKFLENFRIKCNIIYFL